MGVSIGQRVARLAVAAAPFLEDELLLLADLVPAGGTCVDIGANNGIYTTVLSRIVGPTGLVIALEPQPFSFRVLSAAARGLRLRNVDARRIAVSAGGGAVDMVVPRRHGLPVHGRAFIADGADVGPEDLAEFDDAVAISVPTLALDDLLADLDRLDFVKCDVEGAELDVLRSGAAALRRHQPNLLVEIEARHTRKYGHAPDAVFGWLAGLGYRASILDGRHLRPVAGILDHARNYVFTA